MSRPAEHEGRLAVMRTVIGPCREWLADENRMCCEPSEYVLWGKLIPAEGLGPRCYDHALEHTDHYALRSRSGYAVIHLRDLARALAPELVP